MALSRLTIFPRRGRTPRVKTPPAHAEAPITPPLPEVPAHLLRRLEFKVLRRLDGFLFGDYKGLFYGPSLDLAEVREYQPGDEVRRMDWNVTARTGKLHVRQYREERELTAWLVVDASPSMNFGTRRRLKRDLAREFAGLASLVITRHGDKVGALRFGAVGEQRARMVPPRTGRVQALSVVGLLSGPGAPVPAGEKPADLEAALTSIERTLRRRSLVFVVSDFLELAPPSGSRGQGWTGALGRLAQRHDVVAVRVSDPAERRLPDVGSLHMRDPETGEDLWLDTSDPTVRAAHARLVGERDAALQHALRAARVDLLDLDTSKDSVQALLRFAAMRRGRHP